MTVLEKYKVTIVEDLDLLYTLIKKKFPNNAINISYDWKSKNYILEVLNNTHTNHHDIKVPIDLKIKTIYGDTDSVFLSFNFNRKDEKMNRIDTFNMGILCGDKLTKEIFNRKPIELEFEKVFNPFILLTKKRYIANKFENTKDPFDLKGVDAKGIALTRRDYSKVVKKCYRKVIDCIMETKNLEQSCEIYKGYIDLIKCYEIDYDDLVVSAQIAKEYSCRLCKAKSEWMIRCSKCNKINSEKTDICNKVNLSGKTCTFKFKCCHTFSLAHINLAQKLLKRNEQIQINDRIQYVYIETDDSKKPKNELAEDFKYAVEHKLKYNRLIYLESIAKPLLSFFKVCLKNLPALLNDVIDYTNDAIVECGGKKLKPSDFKIEDD